MTCKKFINKFINKKQAVNKVYRFLPKHGSVLRVVLITGKKRKIVSQTIR